MEVLNPYIIKVSEYLARKSYFVEKLFQKALEIYFNSFLKKNLEKIIMNIKYSSYGSFL